jgi:flagellar basal-body rod modification protein FlgD
MAVYGVSGANNSVPAPPSTNVTNNAQAAAHRQSVAAGTGQDHMSMQDFLMLVVAQLQNQDIDNTVDNGQFMAQMAQIASMQSMQDLTMAFMSSMSMNFLGKFVRASALTEVEVGDGMTDIRHSREEGYVQRVSFNGGDARVLVNNVWFNVGDIFEVGVARPESETDDA